MRTILIIMLLAGLALAQETEITEADTPTEVAPGITVTVSTGAASQAPLEVAQEVIIHPRRVEEEIPYDRETTRVSFQVTSRIHTEIIVEAPEAMVARDLPEVRLPPGASVGVSFTAFEPHEGEVYIYNTMGDLLETIPYVVTKQSRLQQTVRGTASTGVSTDFDEINVEPVDLRFGYGIRERSSGVGGQATLGYEAGGNLDLDVSVSGSYSW